jgi:predicted helicase
MNIIKYNKLLKTINSFQEFEDKIKNYDSKEKGNIFELLTKYLLQSDYIFNFKKVYLYDEIPNKILDELKFPLNDKGIDLIIVTKNDKYIPVQCKYRNDNSKVIPWNSLSTFFGLSFGLHNKIQNGFFVTNTYDYCDEINKTNKIVTYGGNYFDNLTDKHFKNINKLIDGDEIELKKYIPRDYQKEIIKLAKEHYSEETLGHIIMACGTGKTLTSYWIAKNYRKIVIFVPSLLLLSQFYNDYMKAIIGDDEYEYNILLIGSDCDNDSRMKEKIDIVNITTDKKEVLKFLRDTKEENKIVFSTYQSSYILDEILNETELCFNFGIYDEVHKTCMKENRMMSKMIECKSINKKLFMTATAKILKDVKNDKEDDRVYSMDDEDVYGKKIYEYNITNAIKDKRLCDYKIYNVHTTENEMKKLIKNDKLEVVLKDIRLDAEMNMKYVTAGMMIIKAFNELRCTHLITYHNTIANAKIFMELLCKLFEKYFDDDANISVVDGGISMKKRRKIINDFQESKYGIICSCRSLCEGINIPIVDSLCFVDGRSSTIDLIQCIGRGLRLFDRKKRCKILMPILLEDFNEYDGGKYSELIRVLKALNTCDTDLIGQLNSADGLDSERGRIIKNIFMEDSFEEDYEIDVDEFDEKFCMGLNKFWKNSVREKKSWDESYKLYKNFIDNNKKKPTFADNHTKEEKYLAMWATMQRRKRRENKLNDLQIKKLDCVKFKWEFMTSFEELYEMVKKFYEKYKKIPSTIGKLPDEKRLGKFCAHKREEEKRGVLTKEKRKLFEKFDGWIWTSKKTWINKPFDEIYKDFVEWKNNNGKFPYEKSKNDEEKKLGKWRAQQKKMKKRGKLATYRIKLLEKIDDWTWEDSRYRKNKNVLEQKNKMY